MSIEREEVDECDTALCGVIMAIFLIAVLSATLLCGCASRLDPAGALRSSLGARAK